MDGGDSNRQVRLEERAGRVDSNRQVEEGREESRCEKLHRQVEEAGRGLDRK